MSHLANHLVELRKFSPDQLRDSKGRFAFSAGAASAKAVKTGNPSSHLKAMQAHVKAAIQHANAAQKKYKLGAVARGVLGSAAIFAALHGLKSPKGYVGDDSGQRYNPKGWGPYQRYNPKSWRTQSQSAHTSVHVPTALPLPTKLLNAAGSKKTSSSPYRPKQ